jgi:hypothetical protein
MLHLPYGKVFPLKAVVFSQPRIGTLEMEQTAARMSNITKDSALMFASRNLQVSYSLQLVPVKTVTHL